MDRLQTVAEPLQQKILSSDIEQLQKLMNQKEITSLQILSVYFKRAASIGKDLNLISESNFEQATELANQCDRNRSKLTTSELKQLGPMYGIPFSVKECYQQKGFDTTLGFIKNLNNPQKNTMPFIKYLISQGGIPFIRSNLPMSMFSLECVNNIYGRGQNPWNRRRTVGASSGGEAGLVAAKCSPIGMSSDSLGSIRIPASFCGIYGFKPSQGRFTLKGISGLNKYQTIKRQIVKTSFGPIGKSVDDLIVFTKYLFDSYNQEIDPQIPSAKLKTESLTVNDGQLIGLWSFSETFPPCKTSKRALDIVKSAFEDRGHHVISFEWPNYARLVQLCTRVMTSEGRARGLTGNVGKEPIIEELKIPFIIGQLPNIALKFISKVLQLLGENRAANSLEQILERDTVNLLETLHEIEKLKTDFFDYLRLKDIDAILAPAMPIPAIKKEESKKLMGSAVYMLGANVYNMPSGVLPITTVDESETIYDQSDCYIQDSIYKATQKSLVDSKGMPIGIQIMTKPFEDEKCLGFMKIIEEKVRFNQLPDL